MAQTLSFNGIQAESVTFNGVVISNVYFNGEHVFGGTPTLYLRDLNSINEDCLILPNSTLNMDIPATGDFEYGGVFTIPNSLSGQAFTALLGRTVFGASNGRYGVWISSNGDLNVQVSTSSNTIVITNVVNDYGGQTGEVKVRYTSSGCEVCFNDVIVGSTTNTARPSTSTTNFFVGAFGDGGGSSPSSGKYYGDKIHSVFHGANSWGFNEPSGFDCLNQDSLYPMEGQTSNTGGLTYWNADVIKPYVIANYLNLKQTNADQVLVNTPTDALTFGDIDYSATLYIPSGQGNNKTFLMFRSNNTFSSVIGMVRLNLEVSNFGLGLYNGSGVNIVNDLSAFTGVFDKEFDISLKNGVFTIDGTTYDYSTHNSVTLSPTAQQLSFNRNVKYASTVSMRVYNYSSQGFEFECNEPSGFVQNDTTNTYTGNGFTSNAGGVTYWNANVITEYVKTN